MKEDTTLLPQKQKFQMKMITSLTFDTTTKPWWIEFKKSPLSTTIILSYKIIGYITHFLRKYYMIIILSYKTIGLYKTFFKKILYALGEKLINL